MKWFTFAKFRPMDTGRPSVKVWVNPALPQIRQGTLYHEQRGTQNPPHWHIRGPRKWWGGRSE